VALFVACGDVVVEMVSVKLFNGRRESVWRILQVYRLAIACSMT